MDSDFNKLASIFSEMVENSNTFACGWKNLKLGPEAFALMTQSLPLRVKGELTPYTRIVLLNKMLECMPERDCARFTLKVREYQQSMFPLITPEDIAEDMDIDGYEGDPSEYRRSFTESELVGMKQRIVDYLDPNMSMEEWRKKYGCHLRFDDIERSAEWEEKIYGVEEEISRIMGDVEPRMGYCHEYWSTKRAVLESRGIQWRSPSSMNPGVMFD